jgi:integrase/recombinase XerD
MKWMNKAEQRVLLKYLGSLPIYQSFPLVFALETGLRVGELIKLKMQDVAQKDFVWVRTLKQRGKKKERRIPLSSLAQEYLQKYRLFYQEYHDPKLSEGALLITRRHEPTGKRFLQTVFEKAMHACHLRGFSFHSLRHTFAMNMRNKGCSLEHLQYLLGHSNINSTSIYLQPSEDEVFKYFA